MKVSLSVLNVDYTKVYENLKDILDDVDYVHLDVMDGEFVPNISFGPDFVKSLKKVSPKSSLRKSVLLRMLQCSKLNQLNLTQHPMMNALNAQEKKTKMVDVSHTYIHFQTSMNTMSSI